MTDVNDIANEVLDWELRRVLKGLYELSKQKNEDLEINYKVKDAIFRIRCEVF